MCVCVATTGSSRRGLRLSISPRGTQIKKIGSGIIFTCELTADNSSAGTPVQQQQQQQQQQAGHVTGLPVSAEMRWVGPDLQYVTSAKQSRYIIERLTCGRPHKWGQLTPPEKWTKK